MLHAIYLMKFSLYLQAKMSGMSKCRHDEMAFIGITSSLHPEKTVTKISLARPFLKPGLLQHE